MAFWNILRPFGLHILWPFGKCVVAHLVYRLVRCSMKNLATLTTPKESLFCNSVHTKMCHLLMHTTLGEIVYETFLWQRWKVASLNSCGDCLRGCMGTYSSGVYIHSTWAQISLAYRTRRRRRLVISVKIISKKNLRDCLTFKLLFMDKVLGRGK
jgi:hypothetical protein